jgi:hypothetical protein
LDCSKPQKKFRNNAVAPLNTQDESANMPSQSSLNSTVSNKKKLAAAKQKKKKTSKQLHALQYASIPYISM